MNNSDLIYYNFMTKPANHCLDMTDEYYKSCGVSRGNNNGFDISKLKDGDKILYGKYSGTEVNVAGTDYIIMRESDILAIM